MILRDMERGLDPEQMASSQNTNPENIRGYIKSLDDLLSGKLTTAPSSAEKQARVYRFLLGCNLSPALRSYVTSCLRQLAATNSKVGIEEPFRPGTLREPGTLARPDDTAQKAKCPTCDMIHAGECL
jgi:hypothetical protein